MSKLQIESIDDLAKFLFDLSKSDRDVIVACGGMTGEGKSTFMILLQKAYAKYAKTLWSFKTNMTWDREELLKWIDGDKDGKGKKPEFTAIVVDELISLFFNRNWWEEQQKTSIELLNKFRDRHLFVGGNVPNFWDLDSAFRSRIRFYVYIPMGRGKAWLFDQEHNPFSTDPWNVTENKKIFRKKGNPFSCPNFQCEVPFPDLSPEEKKGYLAVRNTKRRHTEGQSKKFVQQKYKNLKLQRDNLIRWIFDKNPKMTLVSVSEIMGHSLAMESIRLARTGER